MTLNELKKKWIGKSYREDSHYGAQCVSFVKIAIYDLLGLKLKTFNGSAIAGWLTGSPFGPGWKRVLNSLTAVPKPGDVLFFDRMKGNVYGHTAIAGEGCTQKKLVVIEQNAGSGNGDGLKENAIKERTRSYMLPSKCLGWYTYIGQTKK